MMMLRTLALASTATVLQVVDARSDGDIRVSGSKRRRDESGDSSESEDGNVSKVAKTSQTATPGTSMFSRIMSYVPLYSYFTAPAVDTSGDEVGATKPACDRSRRNPKPRNFLDPTPETRQEQAAKAPILEKERQEERLERLDTDQSLFNVRETTNSEIGLAKPIETKTSLVAQEYSSSEKESGETTDDSREVESEPMMGRRASRDILRLTKTKISH